MASRDSRSAGPSRACLFATGLIAAWVALTCSARAGEITPTRVASDATDKTKLSAGELSRLIDSSLATAWSQEKRQPAPLADDAQFLRRLSLDVVGKIPSVSEVRQFAEDPRPDKRVRKVDELLGRGAFAAHFARVWRDLLLAGASNDNGALAFAPQLETWLRLRFATNIPYDQMVRELLTDASSRGGDAMNNAPRRNVPSVQAYYQANESKPEMLAASTSRLFLGVQVQCAQCHDHPFAHWKQKEFWSFAALFSPGENMMEGALASASTPTAPLTIKIPQTEKVVEAAFLGGAKPTWARGDTRQTVLARWITSDDNPLFARAAVNRVWEHFFGRGFVFPVDNLDRTEPPVYPELFNTISRQFVLHDYDLHYVIRALAGTQAYQATSARSKHEDDDDRHFARIPVRRLSGDQLYDSIVQATGFRESAPARQNPFDFLNGGGGTRAQFLQKFADQSVPKTEAETSILQALSLMNGKMASDVTNLETSETLAAVLESPFLDNPGRIDTLYLAALSRQPDKDELKQMSDYVTAAGAANERAALADVFWALLNSAEFLLNH